MSDAGHPLLDQDRAARWAAQSEFDAPLLLEAGAGTGKTATLVARILAWSLGPGWERSVHRRAARGGDGRPDGNERIAAETLDRIVAITFTDAAAAEMATRTAAALAAVAADRTPIGVADNALPADPELRRARARALLANLDRLRISTIHGFCRRVLAEHPLAAGLHPLLEVDAESAAVEEEVRRAVEDGLLAAYARRDADALALAADGIGPDRIAAALEALASSYVSSAALAEDPFSPAATTAACGALGHWCGELLEVVGGAFEGVGRAEKARETLAAVAAIRDTFRAAPDDLVALQRAVRDHLTDTRRDRLRTWAKGEPTATEERALGPSAEAVGRVAGEVVAAGDALASLDPAAFNRARRVLHPLLARLEAAMRRRGAIPFEGLLAEAAALLASSAETRARVRRGIDQLLVDEFQDTDRMQCEVVRTIALDGAIADRPGLFLVGDPKQSIYGWRNADLRAYDEFVGVVEAAGGRRLPLVENYRSVPAILAEVERVVAPIMREEPGVQPPFRELLPSAERSVAPGFTSPRHGPVEHWTTWDAGPAEAGGPKTSSSRALDLEAAAVARDILALHREHGVAWCAVGVLLRSTGELERLLRAFQDAGVPYAVERDRSYFQRREVIEASALVRCVLDPADHLALLTVLRSALVGVPDAALVPLWSAKLPSALGALSEPDGDALGAIEGLVADAASAVPADVPGIARLAGWPQALVAFSRALARLRASFEQDAPDVFVERLRELTLIEPAEASRRLGAFRIANLDRLFRRLAEALAEDGDAHAVLRALRRSVAESRDAEEGRPLEAAEDAVRVMTIHKAKGLAFDHVYLLQTHRRSRSGGTADAEADRTADGWTLQLFGRPDPNWGAAQRHRRRIEQAELVRTLYVAMTRARERLVLSGSRGDGSRAALARAVSHAQLLELRRDAPMDLPGRFAELTAAGAAQFDHSGARWVFPALRRLGPDSAGPEAARPGPDLAAVRRDGERLAAAAGEAQERMARPWRATASEEAHRELFGEGERDDEPPAAVIGGREIATIVGTAVHAVLERTEVGPEGAVDLSAAAAPVRARLAAEVHDADRTAVLERFDGLIAACGGAPLGGRLKAALAGAVARELPVLVPPTGEDGPVAAVVGIVDLVYRDPECGELVVADYKTDAVHDADAIAGRAAAYAAQGRVYTRAVAEALGLPQRPRFELWFLATGAVVTVPDPTA